MYLESPAFKRCCFCMPLRRGLIGWGYVRLAVGVLVLAQIISLSIWVITENPRARHVMMVICLGSTCLLDITFNLILIVGSHKKSAKLLTISLILGVMWFILFLAFSLFILYSDIRHSIDYWYHNHFYRYVIYSPLVSISFTFTITFVHIYVMLMIYSEVKKLRNRRGEVQFVNNAVEGEAACLYASAQAEARTNNMTL